METTGNVGPCKYALAFSLAPNLIRKVLCFLCIFLVALSIKILFFFVSLKLRFSRYLAYTVFCFQPEDQTMKNINTISMCREKLYKPTRHNDNCSDFYMI